ncbi:hypothetical protein BN2127_JRS10_05236 [Bacillus subtilis]|nr:hypothetical protein BN2127_JRS10_05236 [Bacillus subtilis]
MSRIFDLYSRKEGVIKFPWTAPQPFCVTDDFSWITPVYPDARLLRKVMFGNLTSESVPLSSRTNEV